MTTDFDPAAKERELQAEATSWETASPVRADPGDVPVIDVAPYFSTGSAEDLKTVADKLRVASEQVGFYQLVGHGIPPTRTDEILATARRFHDLPVAVKESIVMDRTDWPVGGVGYLPVGERKLPRREKGNQNEAFLIKSDRDIGFEDNQWLPEASAPGFRSDVEDYAGAIVGLALRLLPIYAAALDLEPEFFTPAFQHPLWRLRLTHYPPAELDSANDGFGIAPHVDTTFFTLLLQDGPGLNIFSHRRNQWIAAPVVPGAFVVNSGELLRQWSNDRFLSTRHYANNDGANNDGANSNRATNDSRGRYSVPFFFNATADYPMECLPSCHGPGNPPKYPTISYLESQAVVQGE